MSNLKLGVIRSITNADRAKEIIDQAKREHKRAVAVKSDKGWAIRITKPQSQIEKLLGYFTRQNQREKSRLETFISSLPPAKRGSLKNVVRKQAVRKSGVGSARPEQITKALAKNSDTKLLTPSKSSGNSTETPSEQIAKATPTEPQQGKTAEEYIAELVAEFAPSKSSDTPAETLSEQIAKAWPTDPEQGKAVEEHIAQFAPSKSSGNSAETISEIIAKAWPTDPDQAKTAQSFKESINGLPQSIAKTDALQTTEDKEALESLKPIEQSFLSPLKQKTQQAVKVAVSTEQAAEIDPVPTLAEVIGWYKGNDIIAEFTPGFRANRLNDFIAFSNNRVRKEIIAADGGRNSRANKQKHEKVHISIDRKQFPQAWEKLAPLLFSKKNPFLQFKLSSLVDDECLENSKKDIQTNANFSGRTKTALADLGRVSEGLQLTFYFTPPEADTSSAQLEKEARESAEFLKEIATALEEFDPGKVYGRTFQLNPYIDYRNEAWARGDTSKPAKEALTVSPYSQAERNELQVSPFFSELQKAFA